MPAKREMGGERSESKRSEGQRSDGERSDGERIEERGTMTMRQSAPLINKQTNFTTDKFLMRAKSMSTTEIRFSMLKRISTAETVFIFLNSISAT